MCGANAAELVGEKDNDSAEIWSSIISPTCWNILPFLWFHNGAIEPQTGSSSVVEHFGASLRIVTYIACLLARSQNSERRSVLKR